MKRRLALASPRRCSCRSRCARARSRRARSRAWSRAPTPRPRASASTCCARAAVPSTRRWPWRSPWPSSIPPRATSAAGASCCSAARSGEAVGLRLSRAGAGRGQRDDVPEERPLRQRPASQQLPGRRRSGHGRGLASRLARARQAALAAARRPGHRSGPGRLRGQRMARGRSAQRPGRHGEVPGDARAVH